VDVGGGVQAEANRAQRKHELVRALRAEGRGLREIARHLGWGLHTVQRYARVATWQELAESRWPAERPSKLNPFKPLRTSAFIAGACAGSAAFGSPRSGDSHVLSPFRRVAALDSRGLRVGQWHRYAAHAGRPDRRCPALRAPD
jgi:hypothetical protein